jgi:cell wall-associated NlpC family hydrolase
VGGSIDLSPTDPTQVADANLSPLGDDPDVRWGPNSTPISVADIDRFLRQHHPPSPLLPYENQILTNAHQYGILPEFALAVWQAETQVGTDGSAGSQGHNPGNVGGYTYLDWPSAIGAWYALIAGPRYLGAGHTTVSAIGAVYAPDDKGQNPDWIPNVDATMRALRQGALVQSVSGAGGQAAPAAGSTRAVIITAAQSMVGGSYVWGAENAGTRSFDCSGLTEYAYKQASLDFGVPRSTAQVQYDYCLKIADADRQPGDLLFFHVAADGLGDYINHVALDVGGGQIVQAAQPSVGIIKDVLTEDSINASYVASGRHPKLT